MRDSTSPTNYHPNEYTQGFCYYSFAINLDSCISMCSKQNRRFKSKRFQHDYRNKSIKNINKTCVMQM